MTDRPIIFSAPTIRALLAGRKTQTRRIIKPQPSRLSPPSHPEHRGGQRWVFMNRIDFPEYAFGSDYFKAHCAVGDRLWVREAFSQMPTSAYALQKMVNPSDRDFSAYYRCDFDRSGRPQWKPSIHMPRWASRLTLIVEGVKVERLQEITSADAIAEGFSPHANSETIDCDTPDPRDDFKAIWTKLHGPDAWAANPWVAAIEFSVIMSNIDAMPTSGGTNG